MYQRFSAKPILKDIISFYWVGELQRAPIDKFIHRDIARSTAQLILHYEGSFSEFDCKDNITKSPFWNPRTKDFEQTVYLFIRKIRNIWY